jgi:peptide-methionine (S)-S-oxide reductase
MAIESATLGGGCFWCLEAVYERMSGVERVVSGYTGGTVRNPTYRQVCDGTTGHAEVVRVDFDPAETSYREVLEVFFAVHDPTTLNRQGNDVGTQYRSAIFFHSPAQEETARAVVEALEQEQIFDDPIVTEIVPLAEFFEAEDYHQSYYERNGNQPYCLFVVQPKVAKFRSRFAHKLRERPVDG